MNQLNAYKRTFSNPYIVAFLSYLIGNFSKLINYDFGPFHRIMMLICFGILSVSLWQNRQVVFKDYAQYGILLLVVIIAIVSKRELWVINIYLLIVNSFQVPFDKLLKVSFITLLICTGIVFLGNVVGLFPNNTYTRNGVSRTSFGFFYPTFLANLFFHLILIYLFLKQSLSYRAILFLTVINGVLYYFTNTKAVFFFILVMLVTLLVVKLFQFDLPVYQRKRLLNATMVISVVTPIVLSLVYTPKIAILQKLNQFLTFRIWLGQVAIQKYGFHLFGSHIEWVNEAKMLETGMHYLFVDSSFLNALLNYGFIVFAIVLGTFFVQMKKPIVIHSFYRTLVIVFLLLHSMFDPQFFDLLYNPFLLLVGLAIVAQPQEHKKELFR